MAGGSPEDFIAKVERQWIRVRGERGPAYVHEWDSVERIRGKELQWTLGWIRKITRIILETPQTYTHGVKKRIILEWCWEELYNPNNFKKITI